MLGHDSLACISSRFSTVIHVAASIKETITDLMSHSQFHCKSLTLIRAWLSPRDKHMTTGRINQVSLLVCGVWRLPGSAERQKSFEKWHFENPERGGVPKILVTLPPSPSLQKHIHLTHCFLRLKSSTLSTRNKRRTSLHPAPPCWLSLNHSSFQPRSSSSASQSPPELPPTPPAQRPGSPGLAQHQLDLATPLNRLLPPLALS